MAELYVVIVKNDSGSDQEIEELGITIADSETYNISEQFDYHEIFGAGTLRDLVAAGTLVINNGADLSATDGVDWIEALNTYKANDRFYTKTQLGASGSSAVHWDNISNTPAFGAMTWKEPVIYRVLNTTGSTTGAVTGDIIVNGGNYEQYDGSSWNTIGTVTTGDRVIDLAQVDNAIVDYDGSVWAVTDTPVLGDAVMVDDDGDGKQAQYVYNDADWMKIGDVDFAGHFDGGANKHDASEIDTEGTYTNIPGTPTDLETTISAIDTKIGEISAEASDKNTLNEAYDEGGAGVGREITVDAGAVKFSASGGYAPMELTDLSSAPNTSLIQGQMCMVDGVLYCYDSTRLKWLSVQRELLVFGRKGRLTNGWLSFGVGSLPSNNSGYRLLRNGVIIGMSVQCDKTVVNGSADIHVRRNDASPNITTLTILSGTYGSSDTNYNVNVLADEFLQCRVAKATSGGIEDPVVMIELAYII